MSSDGGTLRGKTEVRQMHKAMREAGREIDLAFFLQDWSDAYNVGGMFRVADGVGARQLVMSGKTPVPENPMIGVTSLGHHRRIPWRHFPHHEDAAHWIKDQGYALVALEIAEGAVPYHEYEFPDRTCLILGNEQTGVYGKVMKLRDAAITIPMYGKGRSLNVHVAAAIVAFHARLK